MTHRIAPALLLLLACGGGDEDSGTTGDPLNDVDSCIADFAGSDYGEANVQEIEADCLADGGTDCDASSLITLDGALCLAAVHGLGEGIFGYDAWLVYHQRHGFPRWTVQNVLTADGVLRTGEYVAIHGTNGGLVEQGPWETLN